MTGTTAGVEHQNLSVDQGFDESLRRTPAAAGTFKNVADSKGLRRPEQEERQDALLLGREEKIR
jgi:hypothetical protein